jgi:hypothetical protein
LYLQVDILDFGLKNEEKNEEKKVFENPPNKSFSFNKLPGLKNEEINEEKKVFENPPNKSFSFNKLPSLTSS